MRNFTVHDLPPAERPRERLANYGGEALSILELLQILLGRGNKHYSVNSLSQTVLAKFGSLQEIAAASLEDLQTIPGLGSAKSCQIKACFELARRVYDSLPGSTDTSVSISSRAINQIIKIIRQRIGNFKKEHCILLSLDARQKLIGSDTISIGTLTASLIHPREVFNTAIRRHAANIIIAHNHPSGDSEPSNDDVDVTKRLISAGQVMAIPVIDHIIVTTSGYFSFKERNLML